VGAAPSGEDLVEAATQLVEEHADRGIRLSFSEAIGMLTDTDVAKPEPTEGE
jgi:urease gamma subunit